MKKFDQLSLFTNYKQTIMNYKYAGTDAVIAKETWDQLHTDDRGKFEQVEQTPTHGIRDYHVLFPLDGSEEGEIDFYESEIEDDSNLENKPKSKSKKRR